MRSINRARRLTASVAFASLAAASVPGGAEANTSALGATPIAITVGSQATCVDPVLVTPYAALGDVRDYVLAPGGNFTAGLAPGWQLNGSARLVTDGSRGQSLALSGGASVVSPAMCIDLNYPHLRLAYKMTGANVKGLELRAEVVYPQLASPQWTEVSQFDAYQGEPVAGGWRISKDIELKPDFAGSAPGARYVALRFTAVKKETTSAQIHIDDVFIDPYRRT